MKHLKAHELFYEIKIRGTQPQSTVAENRSILRGLLAQEQGNRSLREIKNEIAFSEDEVGLRQSLEDLDAKIQDFKGMMADEEYKRLATRLTLVSGRLKRLNVEDDEEADDQKVVKLELEDMLIALESQLAERVNSVSTPRHSSTPVRSSEPQYNTVKTIPVYKWGIRKFSGQGCLISFLELVESLRISRGCSTEELFSSAGDLFEGQAWQWWHNHHKNHRFSTWDELVVGLKFTFISDNYDRRLMDEIRSRKQGNREPVSMYISSMEALHLRLTKTLEEKEMVENIQNNLLPDYTKLLALQDVSSIEQLTKLCRRIESTLRVNTYSRPQNFQAIPNRSFPQVSQQQTSSAMVASIKCWNCGGSGHAYPSCNLSRKIFCYGCGKKGFFKAHCPTCSKNDPGLGNTSRDAAANPNQNASIRRGKSGRK